LLQHKSQDKQISQDHFDKGEIQEIVKQLSSTISNQYESKFDDSKDMLKQMNNMMKINKREMESLKKEVKSKKVEPTNLDHPAKTFKKFTTSKSTDYFAPISEENYFSHRLVRKSTRDEKVDKKRRVQKIERNYRRK